MTNEEYTKLHDAMEQEKLAALCLARKRAELENEILKVQLEVHKLQLTREQKKKAGK